MLARRLAILGLLAFALLLVGCDALPGIGDDPEPIRELTAQEAQVVEAETDFGLDLFRRVRADEGNENVFLSPLSVSMALGMTMNGADSTTYDAMRETLGFSDMSEPEINEAYRDLIDLLVDLDPKVTVEIANSIWHRDTFAVEEDFLDTNREHFDATVGAIDFDSNEAVETMNGWVEDETNGLIDQIVEPPIDALTMMYLINAVYFKGDWTHQFDPDDTEREPFTRPDSSTVTVDMMKQTEVTLPYLQTDRFQMVDVPYGDSLYSMTVLLPHEEEDLASVTASLTASNWQGWIDKLHSREVNLHLPKFDLEYEKTLNEILAAMGMEEAFNPVTANFRRINPNHDDLHISEVAHKTFLSVDEEGTEAGAATSVGVSLTSAPPTVRVDRPFLLAIREQHSGTLLFIGQVTDPTS